MNEETLAMLDQQELFQLALKASRSGDSGTTIAYLKGAVSRSDATANAHYMLGAEYAQLQMYDRAADELEMALALDPALATARLQLGLLFLSAGQADRAASVLQPLTEGGVTEALSRFGAGLLQLIAGELPAARACFLEGIELNTANVPLNADMQRIVTEIDNRLGSASADASAGEEEAQEDTSHHIFLSAYAGNSTH